MKTAEAVNWKECLPAFKEKTEEFLKGSLDKKAYKGFSGKYGCYAQRDGKSLMLRLRMTGGRVTKDRLQFVAEMIERYNVSLVHLTTCQTIQFHNLSCDAAYEIMEQALDHGIITIGGGGDFPRNVTMSPLSGTQEEYFDVVPYAEAASEFLMGFINKEKMPRKFKVSFSNGPANIPHSTFRDLGFTAREDGKFDVYSAGGLGANPKFGLKVAEAVEPEKILYYIQAMWETFRAYGNYENRAKARTRYMQQTLGEEGYKKAFQEKLEGVFASGDDLTIHIKQASLKKVGDESRAEGKRIFGQKQEGLYTVHYHPVGGEIKPSKFRELYEVIKDMDEAEIRLSPDESLYVINLTGAEAMAVAKATQDGAESCLETSVACIGAGICQGGVRDSQKLLKAIVKAVREAKLPDSALPQLHISGCPSSCGTHQIGVIGFRGGVKMIDKIPHPAFNLFLNGCDLQNHECMGKEVGTMLEEKIPEFIVKLGKTVEESGKDFGTWIAGGPEELEKLAGEFLV